MAFCSKCGNRLEDGAKFCSYCGEKTPVAEPPKPPVQPKSSERKSEYAGTLIKCPSCGADIPSLTAICPSCGHELSSARGSESVASFIAAIDDCDRRIAGCAPTAKRGWSTWGIWKKIGWVLLNMYFFCIPLLIYLLKPYFRTDKSPALSAEEKHKATIIENYTFPNDRGSILEALLFVKTKVGFLVNSKVDANNAYWMRLWAKKAEQLHQQAEILFPGDKIANDTYAQIESDSKQMKKKMQIRIGATVGVILIALIFLLTRGCSSNINSNDTDPNATYDWPQNQFTAILPEPEIETGKIVAEYTKQFQFELYNVSPDDFEDYVKACRNAGFTIDITKTDSVFYADNADGYDLNIFYYDDDEEMHVSIDCYDVESDDNTAENDDSNVQSTPDNSGDSSNPETAPSDDKPETPEVNVSVAYDTEVNYYSNDYLIITDFGYQQNDEYIWCVVELTNPSKDTAIELPTYRVTAYDSDNKILGSEEQTLSIVYPGQEFICASVLIEVGQKPHRIDITVLEPEDYNITAVSALDNPVHIQMVGQNLSVTENSVTGEIYNPNDYKIDSAMITVIFRDDDGNIVYSRLGFIDQIPANGKTPFDISMFGEDGLPDNCEVYAYIW